MDIKAKVQELVNAGSVCPEAKAAGEAYLKAYGTPEQKKAGEALVKELKEDVCSIDGTIAFAKTDAAKSAMGADGAAQLLDACEKAKAAGEKYCICPACQAGAAILNHTDLL